MKKANSEKSLKPSQRESITGFTSGFGSGQGYSRKVMRRKIARAVLIALIICALVYTGFFFTELLLRISESTPEELSIRPESAVHWISYLTTRL